MKPVAVLSGARVLVTGGTGMIGANLVRRLVADSCRTYVLTRPSGNRTRLQAVSSAIEFLQADVADADEVRTAISTARPDVVFHLASTPFNPQASAETHVRVNILGTLNVVEALWDFPAARVVFTGSVAAYGAGSHMHENHPLVPATVLGATKACAGILLQSYARLHQRLMVELRLTMPYGPWDPPHRLIPHTILSALSGRDVSMSPGTQRRDFVYVDDVVEALILGATMPVSPGSVINIGSGSSVPIINIVERILSVMGNPVRALPGAVPMRADEIMDMSVDTAEAARVLSWRPSTSLEEGLRRSIDWFTAHRDLVSHLA